MMEQNTSSIIDLIRQARSWAKTSAPVFSDVTSIRGELRSRRKKLIRSFISLEELVGKGDAMNEAEAEALSDYLAQRTVAIWKVKEPESVDFCKTFYTLAIVAIASGNVGSESVDDIIQLAECLVRSRDTFTIVMKGLLPAERIGSLFRLVSEVNEGFFDIRFEDAVLGGVAVFLGALEDPLGAVDEERLV